MIIFDLDGTLANCDHRRHFVDPTLCVDFLLFQGYDGAGEMIEEKGVYCNILTGERFKPDWRSFYEACDKDSVISPTRCLLDFIAMKGYAHTLEIWSGRCESVREKTQEWLKQNSFAFACHPFEIKLKMRPIGDYTPDDQLKEIWLDEALKEGKKIQFVFDDRPKVVRMWRRRGIFVFNCCQHDKEF